MKPRLDFKQSQTMFEAIVVAVWLRANKPILLARYVFKHSLRTAKNRPIM